MSINRTLLALALGLALAACTNADKAQDAASATPAAAPAAAAPAAAPAATPAPAAAPAAASTQATAANTAATTATAAAAQASNSAVVATNASGNAAIQSQDINAPGFTADLIEAKRSDNVLSIKVRVKNTGTKTAEIKIYERAKTEAFYVQAEGKKYFVLTDTEKAPLATPSDSYDGSLSPSVAAGASFTWWAKYPAPPAEVKKFSFYWPLGAPFDDVPITDK